MPAVGDRIGPFELVERISRRAHTSVFYAVRSESTTRGPREVALRVADPGAPEALEALKLEYEVLRLVEDERIPRALALYEGHGAMAMEWVKSASLRDTLALVSAGRLDLEAGTSLDILVELAYALRNVHSLTPPEGRIVHGSLAPAVVHLTAEGRVVLYGLADAEPAHTWPLAPEQQRGVNELATDQWLLGALGLELLRHAPQVLEEARGAPIDVTFGLLQARWPAVTRVLARALAEAPEARYDSEERFIKDLLAVARSLGGGSRRAEVGARTIQLAGTLDNTEPPPVDTHPLLKPHVRSRAAEPEPPRITPSTPKRSSSVTLAPMEGLPAANPVRLAPEPVRLTAEPVQVSPEPVRLAADPVRVATEPTPLPTTSMDTAPARPTLRLAPDPARVTPEAPRPEPITPRPAEGPPEAKPPAIVAWFAANAPPPADDGEEEATVIDTRPVAEVEEEIGDFDWEVTGEHPRPERPPLSPEILPEPPRMSPRISDAPEEEISVLDRDPPRPPPADPIPDRWVGVALAVFSFVAIAALLWALAR